MLDFSCSESEPTVQGGGCFFDIAIIGAGVAGLYATYCCGIAGLNCCLVDSMFCVGGQCGVLYPEKKIYGVPGFLDITAKDYIKRLADQCLGFAKELFLGQKVLFVSKTKDDLFCLKTKDKEILSRYLVIASGIGDMKPNVPLNIKGVLDSSSDFIQYYCMKLDIYKDKKVVVAGGGDSAVDFALNISAIAKKVTLIHRRNNLNCEKSKLAELQRFSEQGKLNVVLEQQILEIGEGDSRRFVKTDKETFDVDHIVFCYGFMPSGKAIEGFKELGLQIKGGLISVDIDTMETTIENCYAAGDVVQYVNKKKNIVPSFFEADRAIRSIQKKISQS